ncbi:triose-phosphate transporter family-domain-containing protein [Cubamyces menziesii]|nr:triose-phosphate transporter family-domain-containing protein [Cubamyces menziesii]
MRSPYLSPNSPAELAVRPNTGYFDLHASSGMYAPFDAAALYAWNAPYGSAGSAGGFIDSQNAEPTAGTLHMDFPTLLQSRLGYSPRQRSGFSREAINTPAIDLTVSPLISESGLLSPALPVVSPDAPAASQPSFARRTTDRRGRVSARSRTRSEAFWLALYFAFNLGLTLYNKGVLVRFPYPYTLTAVHALCGSLGGYVLRYRKAYRPASLDARSYAVLAAFSVLYAVNIAISNLSLQLVTIPFHQVVRAATPIFTTFLSSLILGTTVTSAKLVALTPVMLGVILATYGDYYFTALGLLLTLLGTILAALKTIYTNVLQSSPTKLTRRSAHTTLASALLLPSPLSLHPLDLLTRMSPLAFVQCVAYAYLSGEFAQIRAGPSFPVESASSISGRLPLLLLLGNGCIAFGLNVVSFTANGKVGALNMTVAANVKQVLTIVLAVFVFNLTITRINALGIAITLLGGAWYAAVEYREKARRNTRRTGDAGFATVVRR